MKESLHKRMYNITQYIGDLSETMEEKEKMRRVESGKAKKKVTVIVAVIYQFNVSRERQTFCSVEKDERKTNEIDGFFIQYMDVMNVPSLPNK